MTDILTEIWSFLMGNWGSSIVGGVIAGFIVTITIMIWGKKIHPYFAEKMINFSSEEKQMFGMNVSSLFFAAIVIGVGIVFILPIIQVQDLPKISEDDENTQRYYDYLVNLSNLGVVFVAIGVGWGMLNWIIMRRLGSSGKSRRGSSPI